jgi:hypothetical protein
MHAQALRELGYVAGVSEHMAELPAKDLRPRVDPRLWEGMSASPRCTVSPSSFYRHAGSLPHSAHSRRARAPRAGNVRPGRVLVAHPRTPNESWHHAVVLLLEYSPEQGALGLLINRPGTWASLRSHTRVPASVTLTWAGSCAKRAESLLKRSGTGTPPSYRSYVGGSTKVGLML